MKKMTSPSSMHETGPKELMLLNCGVGEDSLESPLDCKEIQTVHSKGDQSWVFFGRNNAKAETAAIRLVIAFLPRSKYLLISWLQYNKE